MIQDQIPEDALRRLSLREYVHDGEWLKAVRTINCTEEDFKQRKGLQGGSHSCATSGEKRKFEDSIPPVTAKRLKKQYTAKVKVVYKAK